MRFYKSQDRENNSILFHLCSFCSTHKDHEQINYEFRMYQQFQWGFKSISPFVFVVCEFWILHTIKVINSRIQFYLLYVFLNSKIITIKSREIICKRHEWNKYSQNPPTTISIKLQAIFNEYQQSSQL